MNENTAYAEGIEAYREGFPLSACPYPDVSDNALDWECGWMTAEEEDNDDDV